MPLRQSHLYRQTDTQPATLIESAGIARVRAAYQHAIADAQRHGWRIVGHDVPDSTVLTRGAETMRLWIEPGELAGHGGRRPGAGRKHIDTRGETARINVRLSQEQAAWLSSQGDTPVAVLRRLIDEARGAA